MKSRSPFRALLLTTGAIAVLAAGGLVVASAALDPVHLRAELQDAVQRATGRALTVSGGVHIRLGLSPRLEVDDIALANLPGGSAPDMLTARSMTAQLALLPLLGGDAVISSLSLQDPNILLERAPDGTGNWQFEARRQALYHATSAPSGTPSSGGGHHSVEIRTIHLRGGQLTWRGASTIALGITAADWSANDIDAPMTFSFSGSHGAAPLNVSATSGSLQRLQGGPVSALAGTWPLTLDVTSAGASLHLTGGVNHPEQWRDYTFRVTANAPSLDAITPMLGLGSLPPLSDVNATAVLQDSAAGELRTSQLSVHAGQSDLSAWIPGLAVHQVLLSAPGPGQLAQLSVDGTYQQQPLRLAGTVTQPDVIGGAAPIQVTLTAAAAGATASARGTIPPAWNTAGLDLAVLFKAPDLAALSPLAGRSLPAAHDVSITAQVQDAGVKLRGVSVHDLVASSSIGDLSGQMSLQWAPRAAVTGTLTSHMLDLDALGVDRASLLPAIWPPATEGSQLQPATPPATDAAPAAPAAIGDAAPAGAALPLARLRNTDADVMLNVGALTAGGQHLSDVQAHLQLAYGKLALNPFRAQSAEGAIIGGVSVDASSDDPPVAVTLRSPSISADAVAGLLGYPGGAHGTMQVNAELSGTGQTLAAIKATLDGHLGLAMVNGEVADSLLQGLIGAALDASGVPAIGGGTNQVRCFASRIDFAAGIGTIRALSADTSRLVLDGTGSIDLGRQTASLHLRPRVRLGPTEIAAPVSLSGPLGALRATLDPVLGGGRVGISIGRGGGGGSGCASQLALARGGLPGPMPVAAALQQPADPGFVIRKPKDLLKGLFH